MKFCRVHGCETRVYAKQLCQMHYVRKSRHGDPLKKLRRDFRVLPQIDRFFKYVKFQDDSCWEWLGAVQPKNGYGIFSVNGRSIYAHRYCFRRLRGKIGGGLTLDHLCRNRRCCNPDHLEPVTMAENIYRGESPWAKNKRKTHCKRGHRFGEDNILWVGANGKRRRSCRECGRINSRESWRRKHWPNYAGVTHV